MTLDMLPLADIQAPSTRHGTPADSGPAASGCHPGEQREIKSGWGGRRAGAGRKRRLVQDPPPLVIAPGVQWYCARTGLNAEDLADASLRELGFVVFLPRELRLGRRRNGVAAPSRMLPLFPRYLFVQLDLQQAGWRAVYSARGIDWLFCSAPERPMPVPQAAIDLVLAQCAPNGVIYPPSPRVPYAPIPRGAKVQILDGPFAGFVGVCQLSHAKRVALLVEMFGGQRRIEIRRNDVKVVT